VEQPRPPEEGCCGSPLGARSVLGPSPAAKQPRGPARKALTYPAMLRPSSRWSCLPLFHPQLPIHSKQLWDRIARKSWRFQTRLVDLRSQAAEGSTGAFLCVCTERGVGGGGGRCGFGVDCGQERGAAAEGRPWKASCRGIRFTSLPFPSPGLRGQPGARPPSLRPEAARGGKRAGPPLLPHRRM